MPRHVSPLSVLVLSDAPAARARWAAFDGVAVVRPHIGVPRPAAASAVVLDVVDAEDPVAAARRCPVHPGEEVVVLSAADHTAALRAAGFDAVTSPQHAVLRALTLAATAVLHDGPIQSLTVARMQLSLATAGTDERPAGLEDLDAVLSHAARELTGVVDALRSAHLNDAALPDGTSGGSPDDEPT